MIIIGVNFKTKVIMKKTIFFLMSLCALTFISCQKEEMKDVPANGAYTYILNGVADPDEAADPATKINVGAMTNAGWPIRWATGDVVEVYQAADAAEIGKASLADGENGKTHGKFTLSTGKNYTGDVVIAHGTGLTYADGVISAKISPEQEVVGSGNSAHIGKNGLAYATAAMKGTDVPVDFVLNHKSAYVRLVLNTTEFKDHTLLGATLWRKGEALAGTLSADVQTGEVSVKSSADYVKAYVKAENVTVFGSQYVFWFSTLPADLTGKPLYVIVHMTKGTSTVTVPVLVSGGNLKSGAVNTITIKDLKTSSAPAWYETVETRYLANNGKSWSYGPENTVLAYIGSQTAKTVELKARGDFRYVVEPKYVQFHYGHDLNDSNLNATHVDGTSCITSGTYTEFELDGNCSVDITVGKSGSYNGYLATMYVKDAGGNVIWGTNVWAVKEVKEITYTNGIVLDRNIGSGYKGDANDNKAGLIVFQWGRPFAFGYSDKTIAATLTCDAVTSLAVSAANPYTFYKYDGVTYSGGGGVNDWWYGTGVKSDSNHINDLWGNPSSSGSGVKSNFDPCPKGYRVASPEILNEVMKSATVLKNNNCYALSYNGDNWAFTRLRWGQRGDRITSSTDRVAYWSNGTDGTNAFCMSAQYKDGALGAYTKSAGRANAFAVRCMKDTENR